MPSPEALDRYAELIAVHGLNVQPDQIVNISTEPIHRDFALLIAEKCYARGAKAVALDLADSRATLLRVTRSNDLEYVPAHVQARYDELVDAQAANLKLLGMEDPDVFEGVDAQRLNTLFTHQRRAMKRFYEEGVGRSQAHWSVVAAATPKWGQKVFPGEAPEVACERLWAAILSACRADRPDCLALWKAHNAKLHARAKKLTEMGIDSLHFRGPGTDLTVGLTERAIFKGGQERSTRGKWFEPNLPTEEVFTTPDFRRTQGVVRTTRPFMIHGQSVEGLRAEFENGVLTKFSADRGAKTFEAYIDTDEGARRLGEVALVGVDSPIFRSGLIFHEILFDENAACHIAIGMAYKFCIRDGEAMNNEEAAACGCNESAVHTDMMISSEQVDVDAVLRAGQNVPLIKSGRWCADFE